MLFHIDDAQLILTLDWIFLYHHHKNGWFRLNFFYSSTNSFSVAILAYYEAKNFRESVEIYVVGNNRPGKCICDNRPVYISQNTKEK